ncbi:MAG: sulfotransferase, partial [Acetobacteraceae bacterium]
GGALPASEIRRLAGEYRAVLRKIGPESARVTDKNPFNFIWIGLIRMVFPRAFIIHCRRDPMDTCFSIHTTHFFGSIPLASDLDDLVFFHGQYRRLMSHWRAVLDPARFLEVRYEELIAEPEAQTKRLIAFCDLPWDDACLAPERNTRAVSTASLWQARQPVYRSSVARWRRYEPWLGPLRALGEAG